MHLSTNNEEMKMDEKNGEKVDYNPPVLKIVEIYKLSENFGVVVSCSAYGGAVTNCN
jgi:hypothetical protein